MADITDALKLIQKKYGASVVHLGGKEGATQVPAISTGILPLDIATGIGGIPRGAFTEIYAPDGVGKTTLCIHIAISAQRQGLGVAFIDMEHRFDPRYASKLGLDLESMYFVQPPWGEAALNIANSLIETGAIKLIIIDSVASLVPKAELDGEIGDQHPGLQARMMSQSLRLMTPAVKSQEAAVIFTNQTRSKMGGMGGFGAGPQETTSGGIALKFYASMRLNMRRISTVKEKDVPVAQIIKVTVQKNSLAIPLRVANLVMRFGSGFDSLESTIELAIMHGIIEQRGAWFSYSGQKYQGKASLKEALASSPILVGEIESLLKDNYMGDVDFSDEDSD